MLYAIFCYNDERDVTSWAAEHDGAVMDSLAATYRPLAAEGRLGPVARLEPTATARTLRKGRAPFAVTDGPYAETKEQILGFYVVDCASADEAMELARRFGEASPSGAYEVRPIAYFEPGALASRVAAPAVAAPGATEPDAPAR